MTERIWNGTVVREKGGNTKGVVISQTQHQDRVVVRWEGGALGEWTERVYALEVLDEQPVQDGTRAYS